MLDNQIPLTAEEVINCFRNRWGVTYDIQLMVRNNYLYFQIMWGYLEQQSFPLNEEDFNVHINEILEIVNRTGQAEVVRVWMNKVGAKPRIGRALTLQLKGDERLEEFVL
ncbi:DUF3067 family protein [Prochlorococcus sp. MIT 1223]|uniref:DUF3067 family protein n=1 Tax=Prochlorococcus sp. MIT 1223 TaxID=3096217 RepID=UPI002A76408F|nr:DUF3067 family protein [Prochlorococcus sp. MIT 1223]